jgi:glutamate-1-semialdehyde aminotransferase
MTMPFRYNDIESLNTLFSRHQDQIACVIMEPMGAEWPENDFLHNVKDLCNRNGALLIFDEVVTGFRFSIGGAQAVLGVEPDITCLGKAMANGYPISAIGGRAALLDQFKDVFYSFTYGGELPAIAAAIETINILKNNDHLEYVKNLGDSFVIGFNQIAEELHVNYMRAYGHGSWPKYEIDATNGYDSNTLLTLFQQELVRRNLLTRTTPFFSAAHSKYDIKILLDAVRTAMLIVNKGVVERCVDELIDGEIIQTIIRDENVKH